MRSITLTMVLIGMVLIGQIAVAKEPESFTIEPKDVTEVRVTFRRDGLAVLAFSFTETRAPALAEAVERNLNRKIQIVTDGQVVGETWCKVKITGRGLTLLKPADEAVAIAKHLMQELPNQSTHSITGSAGSE